MNTVVTSREAILDVSRELIRQQGWTAVNIRTVASACGVSVGSIYNYFNSKSDLVTATVESIWHDIFRFPEHGEGFDCFTDCIRWIFDSMKRGSEIYPGFFTSHPMGFLEEEKKHGKQRMTQSWEHIQRHLFIVLMNDRQIRPEAFDRTFTPEKFVDLIFSLIISALLRQDYDCGTILEMIHRTIY